MSTHSFLWRLCKICRILLFLALTSLYDQHIMFSTLATLSRSSFLPKKSYCMLSLSPLFRYPLWCWINKVGCCDNKLMRFCCSGHNISWNKGFHRFTKKKQTIEINVLQNISPLRVQQCWSYIFSNGTQYVSFYKFLCQFLGLKFILDLKKL